MAFPATEDRLRPGDHVCWTFDDERQRLAAMARYVRAGLRRREKVVYLTGSLQPVALLAGLHAMGVDTDRATATGQLRVGVAGDGRRGPGGSAPEPMVRGWAAETAEARRGGWAGLRVTADMSWALRPTLDADTLVRYEEQVNRAVADDYTTVVCQYDRRLFPAGRLRELSAAHPGTAQADAGADWQPLLRITRTVEPPGLRVSGEVDLSNRHALATTLRGVTTDRARPGTGVVVDLAGLRFADVATAVLLHDVARTCPGGVTVTGCPAPFARLLDRVAAAAGPARPAPGGRARFAADLRIAAEPTR